MDKAPFKGIKKSKKTKVLKGAITAEAPSAAVKKRKGKSVDRQETLEGTQDQEAATLLTIAHTGQWSAQSGHEILASADRSDKPSRLFSWLIAPMSEDDFEAKVKEQRPLYITRSDRNYFHGWFDREQLKQSLHKEPLKWTEEVDVTEYVDGKRQTLNGKGLADADELWAAVERGCSMRLSWPQRRNEDVWGLLSNIEEYFACGAGCNLYLTPSGAQGFAPHWDEVDVFVMQIEGPGQTFRSGRDCSDATEMHASSMDGATRSPCA